MPWYNPFTWGNPTFTTLLQGYKKYGSVYRVLEINSSNADESLGIGESLVTSLAELPDVNSEHVNQFLEEPLNNIFNLYDDKHHLASAKSELEDLEKTFEVYENLSNQLDDRQQGKLQLIQKKIDEYNITIIEIESDIKKNPINILLEH